MGTQWHWPGSRWWRVDLHTHSPASSDFRPPEARDARDFESLVEAFRSKGLDAVAITDHNTPDGIAELRAAAAAGRPVVFPGVEVTVGGIHLLCIFDPARGRDEVVSLLGALGIEPKDYGKPETTATVGVSEVLELAAARSALVVAAHVNGPKGLLGLAALDRNRLLDDPHLAAVELVAVPNEPGQWREPDSPEVEAGLGAGRRRHTRVWSSDSHSNDQAGKAFSWVKMTRPDLEGLRLALLDGNESVLPCTVEHAPNRHASLAVESLTVWSAKYMGRPRPGGESPLVVQFNPWLNAIIGSRGTGKSTLVDLLRKTLRREGELEVGTDSSPRAAYDRRMRVYETRGADGLLTNATRVEVVYRRSGERYVLSWSVAGTHPSLERLEGETRVPDPGEIPERFPIRIYSQKQLFDLALRPTALFSVIDDTAEVRGAELARTQKEAEARYLAAAADARSLRAQEAEAPAREAALSDVRRKLELLQQGGHAAVLQAYRVLKRHDSTWTSILDGAEQGVAALEEVTGALGVADLDLGAVSEGDEGVAAVRKAHEQLQAAIASLRGTVLEAAARAREEVARIRQGPIATTFRSAVDQAERQHEVVAAELARAGIASADEYRELLGQATALEQEIGALKERGLAAARREADAARELARHRELRQALTQRRQAFAARASSDTVRVQVRGAAVVSGLEDELRRVLGIERFDRDFASMVQEIAPAGGGFAFDRLDALVASLRKVAGDPNGTWPAVDGKFVNHLRRLPPERLDRLALFAPADEAEVKFRDARNRDGAWKDLTQGSPGQQTAALLAFVLGYGDEPIVLDQPEDDLDSTLIYELLVRRLRETKPKRQILVVTHNPNIVVHGDAELIVSLAFANGETEIRCQRGLQEQEARDEICRVMEGGREAFEDRYRRMAPAGGR